MKTCLALLFQVLPYLSLLASASIAEPYDNQVVDQHTYELQKEGNFSMFDSLPEKKLKDLDIYLVIGQSNMAGRAVIEEEHKEEVSGSYLFAGHDDAPWVKATNPLNRHSTIRKEMRMQRLSPSYSFAKTMADAKTDQEFGLVVNAKGGTKIVQWLPGTKFYEDAVTRTKEALKYGKLKGVIWHQGESDSDSLRIGMYLARIEVLVNGLREEFEDPNLPFIAGEVFEKDRTRPFNEMLQQLPKFIKNTALVSSSGTTTSDNTHFDAESTILLGERYAEAMLELQAKQK